MENDLIRERRNYKVVKANEIVRYAKYDLSLTEQKIMAYIFSLMKPTDQREQPYKFSTRDFCMVCGLNVSSGTHYKKIMGYLKGLRDKSFIMVREDGTSTTVGWLSKVVHDPKTTAATWEVYLDNDMYQYVMGLYGNYTQYELLCALPMKGQYSYRIYEILKSYAYTKKCMLDLDELKSLIKAEHFVNFKDFRRRVLEKAVSEINQYTDIEVTYEPVKSGNKVTQLRFHIRELNSDDKLDRQINAYEALDGKKQKSEVEGQISFSHEELY